MCIRDRPYFQRLLGGFRREAVIVSVRPYSFSITPQMALTLAQVVQRLFGPKAELSIAESIAFGGEDELPAVALTTRASLHLVIFNLAATPEEENHGALLKKLGDVTSGTLLALVDESAFRQRFGAQAERLAERRKLWQRFLTAVPVRHVPVSYTHLDVYKRQSMAGVQGQFGWTSTSKSWRF